MVRNKINNVETNFNLVVSNNNLHEQLKQNRRLKNIINLKYKKSKIKPIFSTNSQTLKFTDQGETNIDVLKRSVVVDPNRQLITTAKKIIIVTPKSLKRAKEQLETKTELLTIGVNIEKRISKIVAKNKEKLNNLKEQLDKVNKDITTIFDQKEIAKKRRQIIAVKKQANLLKIQCLLISSNVDFDYFEHLNDEKLLESIDAFITKASSEDIKNLADSCKKDLDYVDNLLTTLDKIEQINYEIEQQDKSIKKRDTDFKDYKEDISELQLNKDKMVDEIKAQIAKSTEIIERLKGFDEKNAFLSLTELHNIADDYINYILSGEYLTKIFHLLTLNIFKDKQKDLKKQADSRNKLIMSIFSNYKNELKEQIGNLKQLSSNIKTAINQLAWLKNVFDNKFYKYKHLIPEYEIIYAKLDDLESNLIDSKKTIDKETKRLHEQHDNIKTKVIKRNYF